MYKISKLCFAAFLLNYIWLSRLYGTSSTLNYVFLGGCLICGFLSPWNNQNVKFGVVSLNGYSIRWIIYIAFTAVTSVLVAKDSSAALNQVVFMIEVVLIMQYMFHVLDVDGKLDYIYNTFALLSVIYAASMFFVGVTHLRSGRLYLADATNPNSDAIILAFGIFSILRMVNYEKLFNMIVAYVITMAELYVIFLTGSRKALILAAAFILFSLYGTLKERKISNNKRTLVIIVGFGMIIIGIWKLLPTYLASVAYTRMSNADLGLDDRFSIIKDALRIFLKYPIFGVGLNNYKLYSASGLYAHSTIPELLADTGIIGTIFYLSPFFLAARKLLCDKFEKKYALILFVCLFAISFVMIIPFSLPLSFFTIILFLEIEMGLNKVGDDYYGCFSSIQ